VLVPDGSADGCMEPILNVMAVPIQLQKPLLYKTFNYTTERHTTDDILEKIVSCIDELKAINVNVIGKLINTLFVLINLGVISDNEPKMQAFRKKIKDAGIESIIGTPGYKNEIICNKL